jgi:hypothetical protein
MPNLQDPSPGLRIATDAVLAAEGIDLLQELLQRASLLGHPIGAALLDGRAAAEDHRVDPVAVEIITVRNASSTHITQFDPRDFAPLAPTTLTVASLQPNEPAPPADTIG